MQKVAATTACKWMAAAAMAMSIGCVGAGDELGHSADSLKGDPASTGVARTLRSGATTHQAGSVRLPTIPAAGSAACGAASPSALVQTSAQANVTVPTALGWRYYLNETPVLHVAAYVKNLCGGHLGRFDFYSPDGRLFRRQLHLFVADANGQNVRKEGSGYVIETELRIEGTEIAGQEMTGVWSVNFAVDNQDRALGLGLFELYR